MSRTHEYDPFVSQLPDPVHAVRTLVAVYTAGISIYQGLTISRERKNFQEVSCCLGTTRGLVGGGATSVQDPGLRSVLLWSTPSKVISRSPVGRVRSFRSGAAIGAIVKVAGVALNSNIIGNALGLVASTNGWMPRTSKVDTPFPSSNSKFTF